MMSYFLSSLLWTVAGLVVGYVIGSAGNQPHFAPRETPVARSRTDVFVGFLLIILAIISVSTMSVSLNRQQRVVECQYTFNQQFADALRERSDSAARERGAMRGLLDTLLNPEADRDARQVAVESYRNVLIEVDATRNENPLPVRPRCE